MIGTVAGLALLGTLAASLHGALAGPQRREGVIVCFVVAASGTVIGGIGAAFWALLAGLAVQAFLTGRPAAGTSPTTGTGRQSTR